MTQSPYGGYDGEDAIQVLRHETREPEYLVIGEPPTTRTILKYQAYYDSTLGYEGERERLAMYHPVKEVVEEWVSEYSVTDLENATLHVYGFRRFHVAWFWKKEEN